MNEYDYKLDYKRLKQKEMNKTELKKILKSHLLKEVSFDSWCEKPQRETFCIHGKEIIIESGKKLGFIIDFSVNDLSCYGGNGNTTYAIRERCINLLLAFLDCKISEDEIIMKYIE